MKKGFLCCIVGVAMMLAVSTPLHSQESKGLVWAALPISLSYQAPLQQVEGLDASDASAILARIDLNLAVQLFFRLGALSLGAEAGISAPIIEYLHLLARANSEDILGYPLHIPIRAVINAALSESVNLDIYSGTSLNMLIGGGSSLSATIDVGARLYLSALFFDIGYVFPMVEDDARFNSSSYWQNSVRIGVGLRAGGP